MWQNFFQDQYQKKKLMAFLAVIFKLREDLAAWGQYKNTD